MWRAVVRFRAWSENYDVQNPKFIPYCTRGIHHWESMPVDVQEVWTLEVTNACPSTDVKHNFTRRKHRYAFEFNCVNRCCPNQSLNHSSCANVTVLLSYDPMTLGNQLESGASRCQSSWGCISVILVAVKTYATQALQHRCLPTSRYLRLQLDMFPVIHPRHDSVSQGGTNGTNLLENRTSLRRAIWEWEHCRQNACRYPYPSISH